MHFFARKRARGAASLVNIWDTVYGISPKLSDLGTPKSYKHLGSVKYFFGCENFSAIWGV